MLSTLDHEIKKVLDHLHNELAKLQVGRANPALVEGIMVRAYGSDQPLKNCASVSVMDAQTLSIGPWDRSLLRDIARGITEAGLGLNPQDNGESIILRIPPITEERRRDLVKIAKRTGEEAKISIRTIRQDFLRSIKQHKESDNLGEDIVKEHENKLQKVIDSATKMIDEACDKKETEIMKV